MLRLNPFKTLFPDSLEQAFVHLEEYGEASKICAGGTDIVPNLKHELHELKALIHLGNVPNLSGVTKVDETLEIGAMTTLEDLFENPLVLEHVPGLAKAAKNVAGPQLRRMGTLGGNLCLDTRCLYFNQTHFWRESLGFCIKKDGTRCHVTGTGKRCVAAASNDTATMLLCFDTELTLASKNSTRTLPLKDFYKGDGEKNITLEPGELLTKVTVPIKPNRKEGFYKLRYRKSIDYPLLSVGLSIVEENELIESGKLTINALAAKPKTFDLKAFAGQPNNEATQEAIAQMAQKRCTPLANITGDLAWRKQMVGVCVKRAASASI